MKHLFFTGLMAAAIPCHAEMISIDGNKLAGCANIESIIARAHCYDDLSRAALTKPAIAFTEPTTPDANPDTGTERDTFGRDENESVRVLREKLGIKTVDEIESRVRVVSRSAYDKLVVTLDNGQVWHQLDAARLPLDDGDAIVIRKAGLGSFLLEKSTGSRKIRVKRVD